MEDPIAYLLTWTTYGTWLPGDERGWIEYRRGWRLPDPVREMEAKARMTEDACVLTESQRLVVEDQIAETCAYRGWLLHAVNCRTNHVHTVISAVGVHPRKIRNDLKAWTTRRLKERFSAHRNKWWGERGSIRWIFIDDALESAVIYVKEGQGSRRETTQRQ